MSLKSVRLPKYGYRRVGVLLEREGWHVNHKRLLRLWRREGLQVSKRPRRRPRSNAHWQHEDILRADAENVVWAWDFIADQTTDGCRLWWLSILDEYNRQCLALEVSRRATAELAIEALQRVVGEQGVPRYLRSDRSCHLAAQKIRRWLKTVSIEVIFISPGSPWENALVEAFHRRMRDEFLAIDTFGSLAEARRLTAKWRYHYNRGARHAPGRKSS